MKKKLAICVLIVLCAALVIPAASGKGKVVKATGKNAAALMPAVDMFPASVYDNVYQIPDAKGKVNMIQPKGNVDVIIAVSACGLVPNSLYRVFFDGNGVTQDDVSTAGPWTEMGTFTTDDEGHGEWNYTAPGGTYEPGTYTKSVFINRTSPNATVLISENVVFEIAAD